MASERGEVLDGRYRLGSVAGRGGMATVYRAVDLRHDRRVAVKILRDGLPASAVDDFLTEIRVTARFHHPHILPLLDSGTVGGVPYFVMPFVRCRSLRHRLEREGRFSWTSARAIIAEAADALEYAHREGIVHLDIKPENILLSEGHAYVTDFGIARALCGRVLDDGDLVVGTPAYMSPEQARGDSPLDGRSDVYSLAAVVHEILTGTPPLRAVSPGEILYHHLHGPPVLPLRHAVLPDEVRIVLRDALARHPDRRPAGPMALLHALDAAAVSTDGRSAGAPELSPPTGGWASRTILGVFGARGSARARDAGRGEMRGGLRAGGAA